jgi:hypothetical protein
MLNSFQFGGQTYQPSGVQQTLKGSPAESAPNSFTGYAAVAQKNGVVFACMLARMQVFGQIRFAFQRLRGGRPSDLFSTPELDLLHKPYDGGTTQDLLSRFLQDADLTGNGYLYRDGTELLRLRPDWVYLVLEKSNVGTLRKQAYVFDEDEPPRLRPGRGGALRPHPRSVGAVPGNVVADTGSA